MSVAESRVEFPVVGIGASAGGLQALIRLFELMPPDAGIAFVVVLHLSPKHESNAAAILAKSTRMPVQQVNEPMRLQPNHVYLIPPNRTLVMNDGSIEPAEEFRVKPAPVVIDLFFRTLASAHRERAMALVLSGMGSDGAVGIARIKEMGGVTIAQLPDDAEHAGMPTAAIESRMVDFVLPVSEMPAKVVDLWTAARRIRLPRSEGIERVPPPATPDEAVLAEHALRETITILQQRTGHDFQHYKRATALRRIERRMQVNGVTDLPAYRNLLDASATEAASLLQDMLIGVTNFFRDHDAFEALETSVVAPLFRDCNAATHLRAWVAGCSTGQEAYSVAILLAESAASATQPVGIQVFATDIDRHALALAREGMYPDSIKIDVSPARLREFFKQDGSHYRIAKSLRERVLFAEHNLLRDPPFSKLDIISCRNLLIYLDRGIQDKVLDMFRFALRPGGYLFLGSSESADAVAHHFKPIDKKHRIFQAIESGSSVRYTPTMPLSARPERVTVDSIESSADPRFSLERLHERLMRQYAPPMIIVDRDGEIVYLSEHAARYLRFSGGEPSHDLLTAIDPALRLDLRTALFQAGHGNRQVESRRVQIAEAGRLRVVSLLVRPILEADVPQDLLMVMIEETDEELGDSIDSGSQSFDPIVVQLEAELLSTKRQLQDTIEQYETSNEELKASNEELQAINEELRSATEELETSKEELQSINEELTTVNLELKTKVDETIKANDDLRNLIASTNIATIFIDRGLRIKRYTPPASGLFNLIASDVDRSLFDITHKLDYPELADDAAEAFGALRSIEREVATDDGRWFLARVQPYRTSGDVIDGAVLTFVDVTKRRFAEQQLLDSEARLRLVFQNTVDYIVITFDRGGRIDTWNIGAERAFGYSEEEALGQSAAMIFTPEDRRTGAVEEELRMARDEGRAPDERWHLRKDGSRIYCSGVMTPIRGSTLLGYAKIARDTTEQHVRDRDRELRLDHERNERADAEQANRVKDEFLAVMSHELKNPLNLININAHLLGRLPEALPGTPLARYSETIRRAVSNQAKIIDDLLDLSRLNTGKLALNLTTVDLAAVVSTAATTAEQLSELRKLVIQRDIDAGPVVVEADETRLQQIVWNLLTNAIKFSNEGGTVTIALKRENNQACVRIVDEGQGIERESLPRLFEMFWQNDSRSTRRHGGLGVGLSIVKQLVDLHGGQVEVKSDGPGRGAMFTVRLPLVHATLTELVDVQAPQRHLEGLKILLVDDSLETLEGFRALLESEGAEVQTAGGALPALALAAEIRFDVVVSDIGMPDISGYQFIARLRDEPGYASTPAIALSGFGFAKLTPAAADSRFDLHLTKPVSPLELLQAVETARNSAKARS